MKKTYSFAAALLLFLTASSPVLAAGVVINPCPNGAQLNTLCYGAGDLGTIIGGIISLMYIVAILVALGYLVWGGLKWITSGGDSKAVDGARQHIISAVIGLIVIFLSYLLLNVVLKFFLGIDLNKLDLPTIPVTPKH